MTVIEFRKNSLPVKGSKKIPLLWRGARRAGWFLLRGNPTTPSGYACKGGEWGAVGDVGGDMQFGYIWGNAFNKPSQLLWRDYSVGAYF